MYGTDRKLVCCAGIASKAANKLDEVIGSVVGKKYSVEWLIIARSRSEIPP